MSNVSRGCFALVFLVALPSLVFGGNGVAIGASPSSKSYIEDIPLYMPYAEQVPGLEREALDGSPKSAFMLSMYFYQQKDPRERMYWLMIAAENGGPHMQLLLADTLSMQHDDLSTRRARFWYNRVILTGSTQDAQQARDALASWDKEESEQPRAH